MRRKERGERNDSRTPRRLKHCSSRHESLGEKRRDWKGEGRGNYEGGAFSLFGISGRFEVARRGKGATRREYHLKEGLGEPEEKKSWGKSIRKGMCLGGETFKLDDTVKLYEGGRRGGGGQRKRKKDNFPDTQQ